MGQHNNPTSASSLSGRTVTVFGSSMAAPGDADYETGERCGGALARAGATVVTGGYAGIMEAVSKGARRAGGRVVAVTAPQVFAARTRANEYVHDERTARSLTERIHELLTMSDATIALSGSLGTLTELIVAWNVAFVARFSETEPKPVIAVGEQWRTIIDSLASQLAADRELVTCVDSADSAVSELVRHFAQQ